MIGLYYSINVFSWRNYFHYRTVSWEKVPEPTARALYLLGRKLPNCLKRRTRRFRWCHRIWSDNDTNYTNSYYYFVACELVTSGSVDGLIMFVDCTTAEILEHQAVFRHLPNIVVVRHSCYMNHHKIFHWRPSCFYTNSLLAEIVAHEKWYTVLLYHDETVGKKWLKH